jgi:hypothetical protein
MNADSGATYRRLDNLHVGPSTASRTTLHDLTVFSEILTCGSGRLGSARSRIADGAHFLPLIAYEPGNGFAGTLTPEASAPRCRLPASTP